MQQLLLLSGDEYTHECIHLNYPDNSDLATAIKAVCDQAIAAVKDEYRTKLEQNLVEQKDDILKMYSQILERLPDINARLRIDQKE